MSRIDYICCESCGCKLIYDGDHNNRDRLECMWDEPKLLCPDCVDKFRRALQEAKEFLHLHYRDDAETEKVIHTVEYALSN